MSLTRIIATTLTAGLASCATATGTAISPEPTDPAPEFVPDQAYIRKTLGVGPLTTGHIVNRGGYYAKGDGPLLRVFALADGTAKFERTPAGDYFITLTERNIDPYQTIYQQAMYRMDNNPRDKVLSEKEIRSGTIGLINKRIREIRQRK